MRVLLISHDIYDGGASRCVRELRTALRAAGHECDVWVAAKSPKCPGDVRCFRRPWERWLSPLEHLPHLTDWRHRGSIAALSRLRRSDYDVVHFHVMHLGSLSVSAAGKVCQRMPTVWTLHDEWASSGQICDLRSQLSPADVKSLTVGPMRFIPFHPYHGNYHQRSVSLLLSRNCPQPQRLITPSQFIADRMAQSGRCPAVPIDVIRNGVPMIDNPAVGLSRTEARRRLGLPVDQPTVLLIAPKLDLPHKGMLLGIRALELMTARRAVNVLMVGAGAVHIVGKLSGGPVTTRVAASDEDLVAAYRSADVTLVPSLCESFSLVAAESMACSTPVVGFRVGGLAELLGDNERGIVVEPYDTLELSLSMQRLLTDAVSRQKLGDAGRDWVFANCQMETYLQSVLRSYDQAVQTFSTGDPPALQGVLAGGAT